MRAIFFTAAALLACADACADGWDAETKASEVAYQVALAVDWYQTDMIARSRGVYWETGQAKWAIGRHPNRGGVAAYMIGSSATHYLVTRGLIEADAPRWVVRMWQMSSFAYEAGTVRANWSIGLRF